MVKDDVNKIIAENVLDKTYVAVGTKTFTEAKTFFCKTATEIYAINGNAENIKGQKKIGAALNGLEKKTNISSTILIVQRNIKLLSRF